MRGFTEESIFNRVENDPELPPREVLGEQLAAKFVRTHGATNYGNEVTCVVSTSENNRELFMKVKPGSGLFIMQQNLETPPRSGEDDKAYFARVSKQVAEKQGHLLFRAHRTDVCLGSQGIDGGGEDTAGRYPGAQPETRQ